MSISARRIALGFLVDCRNGGFSTVLQVRPGTHRFHFLVDGEWRISNEFATAVDSEGNLLNYLEAAEYDNEDFEPYSRSGSLECMQSVLNGVDNRARANHPKRYMDPNDSVLRRPDPGSQL